MNRCGSCGATIGVQRDHEPWCFSRRKRASSVVTRVSWAQKTLRKFKGAKVENKK